MREFLEVFFNISIIDIGGLFYVGVLIMFIDIMLIIKSVR